MAAIGPGTPSAPSGLRSTAGGQGALSIFSPNWISSGATGGLDSGAGSGFQFRPAPKLGEGQSGILERQKEMANKLREEGGRGRPGSSDVTSEGYQAAPPQFQMMGQDNFGLLPPGYQESTNKTPQEWTDREWDFSGVDKGWEQYEADYQKTMDKSNYTPFSPEWMQAAQMETLRQNIPGFGGGIHSIMRRGANDMLEMDARDPYGFGSDYAAYYDQAHGKGALAREANKYARGMLSRDPAFEGYRKGYGDIDWNDATQVEDWLRRANMGGTKTALAQSTTAQNKRTDLTEAGIMMAVGGALGAAAAGAGAIGSYGGTLGASSPGMWTPSAWQVANSGISGAYGGGDYLGY